MGEWFLQRITINMEVINIGEKLNLFQDLWHPRIVGALNGQHVKLVKLAGEFVWHSHENEDELFLVIKGTLKIELRTKTLTLQEGEFVIIPMGVEHKPAAEEEVHVLLFEPAGTINTGDQNESGFTRKEPEVL